MRILLVAGSFDSLTQRVLAELSDRGHAVAVEVAPDGSAVREAVTVTRPIWSWTAEEARPASAAAALGLGPADRVVDRGPGEFAAEVTRSALRPASRDRLRPRIAAKRAEYERREALAPLAAHRAHELSRMRAILDDPAARCHALRPALGRKEAGPEPRTRTAQVRARADRPTVKQDRGPR
ncbi:hypothetical protein ACFWWS_17175 [Streptomyces sp. NPDC059083]|uniref:hypothetical protein n=1 Tax=Streptomyces sp. NPDC059083 TaxID=3346721 RepID=UPI0036D0CB8E